MAENYIEPRNNVAFEEEESSFDIMKWVMLILRHWYLFVISVGVAWGLSYYSNRSWTPTYQTAARFIIQDNPRMGVADASSVMQGFNIQSGFRNVNNQLIMFSSIDLSKIAVERMNLSVDYETKGRFKTNNL